LFRSFLINWGWQWAFISTGILGLIWLIFWFAFYEIPMKHKKVSPEELAYINSDKDEVQETTETTKLSWAQLLSYKQTWAYVIGKFLTDPIWWFYLFWLPDFFETVYHVKLEAASWPVATVYIISTLGSVGGGWLPLKLIKRGWPVFQGKKDLYVYLCIVCLANLLCLNAW
jgi:ACS family hexuronate transporter-like MFS transporter